MVFVLRQHRRSNSRQTRATEEVAADEKRALRGSRSQQDVLGSRADLSARFHMRGTAQLKTMIFIEVVG